MKLEMGPGTGPWRGMIPLDGMRTLLACTVIANGVFLAKNNNNKHQVLPVSVAGSVSCPVNCDAPIEWQLNSNLEWQARQIALKG